MPPFLAYFENGGCVPPRPLDPSLFRRHLSSLKKKQEDILSLVYASLLTIRFQFESTGYVLLHYVLYAVNF